MSGLALDTFDEFFDKSINGFIITEPTGKILRVNPRMAEWTGHSLDEMLGGKFSDFLSIAGRIYYETNLFPLVRMQGFFDEVALELSCKDGRKLPVMVNAAERRNDAGAALFIVVTVFRAVDRRKYEQDILDARTLALSDNTELRTRVSDEVKGRLLAENSLADERNISGLREQFIAVLGHDLRNPLASIDAGLRIISRGELTDTVRGYIALLQHSVSRMAGLIDNVMDFARGRLGGGLSLQRLRVDLTPVFSHVVEELRIALPERVIETDFRDLSFVDCDARRLSQLLSNLVANALTHGAPDGTVHVTAACEPTELFVSVSNTGKVIPQAIINRLFQPFARDEIQSSRQGLGLGLYISSEIARAHGGTLTAASSDQETRFTFRMPL